MSKKSKLESKARNKAAKMSRKNANRALYNSMRDSGDNSKTKSQKNKKSVRAAKHMHLMDDCGNIGCKKCNPEMRLAV